MGFTVERILDNPIIIASADRNFNTLEELPEMMEKAAAAAYETSENPYIIYDFSLADDIDMDELAGGFMNMQQGVPGSVADDEAHVLVVGVGADWDVIVPTLWEDDMGDPYIPTFASVSEALAYIQESRDRGYANPDDTF